MLGYIAFKAISHGQHKPDLIEKRDYGLELFDANANIASLWSAIQSQWRPATKKDLRKGALLWKREDPYSSWSVRVTRSNGDQFWTDGPHGEIGPYNVIDSKEYCGLNLWHVWEGHPFNSKSKIK